jgi:peptidyl-prolyl cis-trans isomerase SurA
MKTINHFRAKACRSTIGCALAAALVAPAPLSAQTVPAAPSFREATVAKVNDQLITSYDIRQRVIWLSLTSGVQVTAENIAGLQQEAFRSLVDEALQRRYLRIQEETRDLPPDTFAATDREVDNYLGDLASQNNVSTDQFLQQLNAQGLSTRTVREQIKATLSWQLWIRNFYGNRVRISDDQARAYIDRLRESASEPQYQIGEIFVSNERTGSQENALGLANQIMTQLQQTGQFQPLARQFSDLPTAANGGDAGWLTLDQMPDEVRSVIDTLRPGQVTPPVEAENGYYIVYLRDRRAGAQTTLVNLKQIAVSLDANADAGAAQAAQDTLLAAKSEIQGCDTLDRVAQSRGLQVGDLGQAQLQDLSPAFQQAVQGLEPDQVSDPIRTDVGLHLIALCDRTLSQADLPGLEEAKDELYFEQLTMIQRRELRNLRSSAVIQQPTQ